jgi:multiple sugar transport system permease protein
VSWFGQFISLGLDMNFTLRKQHIFNAFIFILPGLLLYLIFVIYPILKTFQMSLYEWNIMPGQPSKWVGIDNYARAFKDPVVRISLRNTFMYVLVTVPGQMILALIAALLMRFITRGRTFFRTIYYLPVISSLVVVSLLFNYLFQSPKGIINHILVNVLHLIAKPIPWFSGASTAFIPIEALGIWKGVGWGMVIFLAALQSIPQELYEAASIDGANAWQRLIKITLPLIRPTIVFMSVMLMIGGFNVFTPVLLITRGGPVNQTQVMLMYMFQQAFDFLDFGYGAAIAFILAAMIIVLSFIQIRFFRKPAGD